MCGRFALFTPLLDLMDQFYAELVPNQTYRPRYNIAPTQPVAVLVRDQSERKIAMVRWGLIPSWAKDSSIGNKMINARCETLTERPAFRRLLPSRRCLVLADGFYEWKKEAGKKAPQLIHLKNGSPFAFAGLWDSWIDKQEPETETRPTYSCTIITTHANELISPIHDRMPVILDEKAMEVWLDKTAPIHDLTTLLKPYPSSLIDFYPVSTLVNSPRNESSQCIEPFHA